MSISETFRVCVLTSETYKTSQHCEFFAVKTSDSVVDFNTEIPITFTVTIKTETFQFITLLTWINRVCVSETQKKTENPRYICDIYTLVIH